MGQPAEMKVHQLDNGQSHWAIQNKTILVTVYTPIEKSMVQIQSMQL